MPEQDLTPMQIIEEVSFKRSETIGKLVDALCKAQLAFDPVRKESENPAFKRGNRVSKYADLFSLVSSTRKHLNANGLTIMQFPTVSGKNLVVTTLLAHTSNEWVSHELLLPAADDRGFTAHSIGKAMTYARRFSWQSVTAAVAEDDDDGNDASGVGSREAAQDVADKKIAELKGKKANGAPAPVNALFYTEPESQNGHFAEFINIREFIAAHQDIEDSMRMLFTAHKARSTKTNTALVPSAELLPLLEKLAGDMGVTVKKLDSHA
jgi:ERF superfamily protein